MYDECIIMAGGSGTRLWPASNSSKPKQFLPIKNHSDFTFFDAAIERAFAIINQSGRVIVIAGKNHVSHIILAAKKLNAIDLKRMVLIPEPEAKNTAAAIACGIVYVERTSASNRNIIVLTSDHIITPLEIFKADAAAVFGEQNALAIFAIPPRYPETGYGYVEAGEALSLQSRIFNVASFWEKPDKQKAERFIAHGNFFWNSGMFAFSSRFLITEYNRSAPKIADAFSALTTPEKDSYADRDGLLVLENWAGLNQAYNKAQSISFDYAIAEKCTHTIMVAAGFNWLDVGSWDEYARLLGDTESEVYLSGEKSCFVDSDIPVALCGVEDLIVVVRSGKDGSIPSVLIAKKGETQRVREVVEQIKDARRTSLL
ncbi:MAG: NTP transferase domain-containing protein [Treponema sp.]|jgi:mannose-1-phosphate guanylyltransferase/mannose-6-phosphate isomerase|nr:NTP transferase domain-containing protein [Treponema sp.]